MQTPALLVRSGVHSPSGLLGRKLSLHPNGKVVAIFDEQVRGWEGVHQAYQVREFQEEGILLTAVNVPPSILAMSLPCYGAAIDDVLRDYNRAVVAGCLVEDTGTGHIKVAPGGRPLAFYQLSDFDAERIQRALALLCELLFAAGAKKIHVPFAGVPVLTSADDVRRIYRDPLRKSAMEIFTVHLMGSARMGADRARAVCDGWGGVYDADRLLVCDASLFPSPIGINPCQTIQALATRSAAHVIDDSRRYLS
jgi:choline dehydrogenase-like flavoprotein